MFGTLDVSLQKNGGVAEGVLGFFLSLGELSGEFAGLFHDTHAASTAAEGRFDDEGKADVLGSSEGFIGIGNGVLGAGKDGDVGGDGLGAGGGFVAHVVEEFGGGADEGDALAGAGAGEVGVLREEAVARVDEGDAFGFGEGDDAFVVEISTDGAFRLIELVGFIGLEAVA